MNSILHILHSIEATRLPRDVQGFARGEICHLRLRHHPEGPAQICHCVYVPASMQAAVASGEVTHLNLIELPTTGLTMRPFGPGVYSVLIGLRTRDGAVLQDIPPVWIYSRKRRLLGASVLGLSGFAAIVANISIVLNIGAAVGIAVAWRAMLQALDLTVTPFRASRYYGDIQEMPFDVGFPPVDHAIENESERFNSVDIATSLRPNRVHSGASST